MPDVQHEPTPDSGDLQTENGLESFLSRFEVPDHERKLFHEQEKIMRVGWGVIIAGQLSRFVKVNGEHFFPSFIRGHLSNIADGATLAAMIDAAQMYCNVLMRKPAKSKPIAAAIAALAICTSYEASTAIIKDKKFDTTDQICHTASAAAYLLYNRRLARRREENPEQLETKEKG